MNKKDTFKIGNCEIGSGRPVFVVAEISANHKQNFDYAKKIVKAACECGADAVKLQTFTPDTLTIDSDKTWFIIKANNPWKGKNLYKLYSENYMPWEWQPELKKIADSYGIPLFSTPFDKTAVDFLEKMDVPAYKIASFELVDIELLKRVAATKKPVIISRGMSSSMELAYAIKTLKKNGCQSICVLHCVSTYPAKIEQMNLSTIPAIEKKFNVLSGLSDHSLGILASVMSVGFGAKIIEKHFTLDRNDGASDSIFSLEPDEFLQLVKSVREAEKAIGHIQLEPEKNETEIMLRKSLFIVKNVKKGEKFSSENVGAIRPAYGLAPKFLSEILGKTAKKNIERGTPLSKNLIK